MLKWKPVEKFKQPILAEAVCKDEPVVVLQVEIDHQSYVPSTTAASAQEAIPSPEASSEPLKQLAFKPVFSEPPPLLGERYDVLEFIGSGGMGSVWKVHDKTLNETFAIKVLKPELVADATAVKRFEKEANLASDLTHANIAAIFGPGADKEGRPYIIMRYVDGESLADILASEGKLSEERALDICTQICEALAHSHMKGIIHRDIKPSNIIISKTESGGDMVHVVDFGIARCVYDEVTKTQALTRAVDVFGSPRYMSPEQFLGAEVTGQSDIYSLGCVLYEMLTGAPPFTDENPVRLIFQHTSEPVNLSKIPKGLQTLIYQCLGKEPEQRMPNIGQLIELLSVVNLAPAVTGDSLNILHCMVTIILITSCTLFGIPSAVTHQPVAPLNSFLLLFFWMYITAINRENAGRSVNYKILEVNLLLCAIASAIAGCMAICHLFVLSALLLPFVALGTCWLIMQPRTVEIYSRVVTKVIANSMKKRPTRLLKFQKPLFKGYIFSTRAFVIAVFACVSMTAVTPILALVCGTDLGLSPLKYPTLLSFSMLFITSFMCSLLALLIDVVFCQKKAYKSLGSSLKLQSVFLSLVIITTLAVTSTVGKAGFNQYARQILANGANQAVRERVSLEALTYPDSFFANQSRITAAYRLVQLPARKADAIAMCDQIILSRREHDPATLASAHFLRAKLSGVPEPKISNSSDLDAALLLLENSKKPAFLDLPSKIVWLEDGNQILELAISIGQFAVEKKDIPHALRALEIAKKHKPDYFPDSHLRIISLKKKVVELEAATKKDR